MATLPLSPGPANQVSARVLRSFVPWLVPALIIVIWQFLSMRGIIAARVLPAPLSVAEAGWKLLTEGNLLRDVAISARRAFIGLLIGGSIGFLLGLINGFFPWGARLLDSSVQMGRNIPHLEEAYRFAELVFPKLNLASQPDRAASYSSAFGPFGMTGGEIVANTVVPGLETRRAAAG